MVEVACEWCECLCDEVAFGDRCTCEFLDPCPGCTSDCEGAL